VFLALLSIGRPPVETDGMAAVSSASTPAEVDAALSRLDGHRLVLDAADPAGLNLALARMLRAGLLGDVETAVLLDRPDPYLTSLGLPADRAGQLAVAHTGRARLVGVVKDDSGGVCVSSASLRPWTPERDWWVRAVVDDQRLCDGLVRSLSVRRLGPSLLEAEVRLGRWRRRRCQGRSLQLACDPAYIETDGIPRERARSKRTFWSEPELWRLALPN